MNKNESPALAERGRETAAIGFPRPEIGPLRSVRFGKLRWSFDLTLGPVTIQGFHIVVDDDGRPAFVAPPSIKDQYTGKYRSPVKADRAFLRELFDAAIARLEADEAQSEHATSSAAQRRAQGPSAILLESERRFEDALASFGSGA